MKQIGIIGFGEMGKRLGHELAVATGGMVKIVGVVEPNDTKYKEGCEWNGCKPRRYSTIKEMMMEHEILDGVIISSPNSFHLENLKQLTGYNIPILLEKPLDASYEKICEILRFSEQYQGHIMVDHVMRYTPILIKAKELIGSGIIGGICSVNFVQNCYYGVSLYHNFRRTMAGGGGMFIEKATHDFDAMIYLTEAIPVRVAAISKMQAYGGDKPNDLHCTECVERLTCKESVNNINYRYGNNEVMEVKGSNDLCVYAKEVDAPDNEVCMMEFNNGIFGTYSECFFSSSSYTSREYEIIGLNGIMRISFSLLKNHDKGEIIVCPRYGTPEDLYRFEFDYRKRIHYNGGGEVAKHFFHIMNGKSVPLTTVKQAFIAETLGYAATLAARKKKFIDVLDIIPEDLKPIFKN